ncbi:MAG TPA: G5 domain-containing protein, partial [Anaerolineaceae bacterium]
MSGKIKRLFFIITFFVLIAGMALSGCASPAVTQSLIKINFTADGKTQTFSMPAGASVQQVLTQAGITLGNLDRTTPPAYTILTDGATVKLIRVKENFDVTDVIIAFEHQVVKNESLTSGQTLLIQPGVNGTQEITYRTVLEDGVEVSKTEFKSVIVKEAVPEISMVGIQAPFSPVPITGKLAYLIAGNAWVMQDTTGNRRPIVTSADLDGDIFTLSADGAWLLYSRKAGKDGKDNINTLWVINVDDATAKPIDLKVKNIKNYAGWVPGQGLTVAYSTVEPRPTAPGWQANNDLQLLTFKANGSVAAPKEVIATNSGGLYGWWGATFAWSPDGSKLAYARPDGVGLINFTNGAFLPKM